MEDLRCHQERFAEAMLSNQLYLHRLFSIGLLSVKVEKEATIMDMIQETAEKAWVNYLKPKYIDKSPRWLIRQKAKNVLLDKLAELKKKRYVARLTASVEQISVLSCEKEIEIRDMLKYIYENSEDTLGYEICSLLVAGYTHEEIRTILPSIKETKMKLSRYRKEVKPRRSALNG